MKSKKTDFLISLFLIIITIGLTGLAELVHRIWSDNPLVDILSSDVWVVVGFLWVFLGIIWIWWTGHLLRMVAIGLKLKFYFPLTFCRNPYYAGFVFAFYPASALIFNRVEFLICWLLLILVSQLILFRMPFKQKNSDIQGNQKKKSEPGIKITLPTNLKSKNEELINIRAEKAQAKLINPTINTPCRYLITYGKSAQIAEVFIYIVAIFATIDLLFNPITDAFSDVFRIIAGGIWLIFSAIWLIATQQTLNQHDTSKELVTRGTFRFCRHPLYAGIILGLYPALIVLLNSVELLIGFPFLVIAGHSIAREEEYYLLKLFGEDWENFSTTRPRFFPYFFSNRKDAAVIRKDFASTALLIAGILVLVSVGFFVLTLLGIFPANPDSAIVSLMPFVLLSILVISLPSWEYWKKTCFTIGLISILLLACFLNHKKESVNVKEDVTTFFYNLQKPDVQSWQLNIHGSFDEDGKYAPTDDFLNMNEHLMYLLRTGKERLISDFRLKSFLLPSRTGDIEVEIEVEPNVGSDIIKFVLMKTPAYPNNVNNVLLPKYQIVSMSVNKFK